MKKLIVGIVLVSMFGVCQAETKYNIKMVACHNKNCKNITHFYAPKVQTGTILHRHQRIVTKGSSEVYIDEYNRALLK